MSFRVSKIVVPIVVRFTPRARARGRSTTQYALTAAELGLLQLVEGKELAGKRLLLIAPSAPGIHRRALRGDEAPC